MVSNRIFLRNILQDDYELLEAGNGVQALEQLQRHHDRIAAVLLDVMMLVMDGVRTLEEMGKLGYLDEFPVLIVTSDSDSRGYPDGLAQKHSPLRPGGGHLRRP